MKTKSSICLLFLLVTGFSGSFAQSVIRPNVGLRSHETLEIEKIEISPGQTLLSFIIENRMIANGTFCADKNIYIIYPDGSRIKLINAFGIPQCPEVYKFRFPGEKLHFTLEFPPLSSGTKWIDIIEECSSNCFWLYGVTLDNELNQKVDDAYVLAGKADAAKTILLFRNVLESVESQNTGIEGSLYINIILAAVEAGDKIEAAVWYKRLLSSHAPRLNEYLKLLNSKGISF
jgi:hypothetical protein